MTDMANDQEKRVKQLKRNLEGWREVVLPMHSVLTWEQHWHPGAIAGVITLCFLVVWWVDPAVLTLVSVVGLFAVLVDYLVPTLAASLCRADSWTGTKERRLEDVCRQVAAAEASLLCIWGGLHSWRNARPKLYYATMIVGLLIAAYVGGICNNMLLTYFFVLFVSLVPGLRQRGVLQQQISKLASSLAAMVGHNSTETNDKPKKN